MSKGLLNEHHKQFWGMSPCGIHALGHSDLSAFLGDHKVDYNSPELPKCARASPPYLSYSCILWQGSPAPLWVSLEGASISGVWKKGSEYVDKGGCVSTIILLHFQKAFEKLFVKLLKLYKENKLPQDRSRDLVLIESSCRKRKWRTGLSGQPLEERSAE